MKRLILILTLILILAPTTVLASDISDAEYYGTIQISNNSTATTSVATVMSENTTVYIDGGFVNSGVTNVAIRNTAGADVRFMPGLPPNPWLIYVPTIGASSYLSNILYTGASGGEYRYFPAAGGMTVTDNASLEASANFSLKLGGYIDVDPAVTKYAFNKSGAVALYNSENYTGQLLGEIYYNQSWADPTAAAGTNWDSPQNAWDNNTGTYSGYVGGIPPETWTNYITLDKSPASICGEIRFWTTREDATINQVQIWVYYANAWWPIYDGDFTPGGYDSVNIPYSKSISQVRFRFRNNHPTVTLWMRLHEVDFEISDSLTVTAEGVSAGERDIELVADSTFLGLKVDAPTADFPSSTNLTLNAPLFHTESDNATFLTKDANQHTATLQNSPVWSSDGYTFVEGDSDYIDIPDADSLDTTRTFIAWVYPPSEQSSGTNMHVIASKYEPSYRVGIFFDYSQSPNEFAVFWQDSAATDSYVDWDIPAYAEWYHVVGTLNSDMKAELFVNGVSRGISGVTLIDNLAPTFLSSDINISGGILNRYSTCTIGEVSAYSISYNSTLALADYNATRWKYNGSSEYMHYNYLDGASVPDNSNDWTISLGGSVLYMETANISVGGNLAGSWEWEYATTFTDLSGNGNTATPTFRTTSTDADVSATLISFQPVSEATAPAYAVTGNSTFYSTSNLTVTGEFQTTANATYPGSQVITDVSAAGGTPPQLPTIIIAGVGILGMSYAASYLIRKYQGGYSILFKGLIIIAALGVLTAMGVIDYWMLLMFGIIALAVAMSSDSRLQGVGTDSTNMVAFLVTNFVGMTLINRMLEGRFLQSTDVDIVNSVVAFTPFSVFGWFTIPVPNLGFITTGIPALLRWDYSFFGGNAQILQYLLYSITAFVAFALFILTFGAIYQVLSRARG